MVSWVPPGAYKVTLDVLSANVGRLAGNVHLLPDGVGDSEPESVRGVPALTARRFLRHRRQTSPPITPTRGYARVSTDDQSDLWSGGWRAGVAVHCGGRIAEMGEKSERVSLGT